MTRSIPPLLDPVVTLVLMEYLNLWPETMRAVEMYVDWPACVKRDDGSASARDKLFSAENFPLGGAFTYLGLQGVQRGTGSGEHAIMTKVGVQ